MPAPDPWLDRPFDMLTVLSKVEGLTTPGQPAGSLKIERIAGKPISF
jgi:hypothetical protein